MSSMIFTTALLFHLKNAEIIRKTKGRKWINMLKSVLSNLEKKKKMTIITTLWKTLWKPQKKIMTGILTLVLHVQMSGNARVFCSLEKDAKSLTAKGVHEKRLYVKATGDVSFRAFIDNQPYTGMLKNVLYVPNQGVNLVSICSVMEKDNVQIILSENVKSSFLEKRKIIDHRKESI